MGLEQVVHTVLAQPLVRVAKPGRAAAKAHLDQALAQRAMHLGAVPVAPDTPDHSLLRAALTIGAEVYLIARGVRPQPQDLLGLLLVRCAEPKTALRCWRSSTPAAAWWAIAERYVQSSRERFERDESFGLLLHTGLTALEARHIGLAALEHAGHRPLSLERLERRAHIEATQRVALARALVGLKSAGGLVDDAERRAVLHQLDGLAAPRPLHDSLQREVRRAFRKPLSPQSVASAVRSQSMRRLLLEQVVLASYVDGLRKPEEVAYVENLATALRFDAKALAMVRVEVTSFYSGHHDAVDAFSMTPLAEAYAQEAVSDVRHLVSKNTRALMQELKETGELSVLLSRAARGHRLSTDERTRMREQLVDVAKVLPALAIFTAPGGLLLLLALAKLFKFDVRPSAFREE
jgi:hypothetical protein